MLVNERTCCCRCSGHFKWRRPAGGGGSSTAAASSQITWKQQIRWMALSPWKWAAPVPCGRPLSRFLATRRRCASPAQCGTHQEKADSYFPLIDSPLPTQIWPAD